MQRYNKKVECARELTEKWRNFYDLCKKGGFFMQEEVKKYLLAANMRLKGKSQSAGLKTRELNEDEPA